MKKRNLFKALAIMWLACICVTCEYPPFPPSSGTLTAKVNGKAWEKSYKNAYYSVLMYRMNVGTGACTTDVTYSLVNDLYDELRTNQHELYFENIPQKPGKYAVTSRREIPCVGGSNKIYCILFSQVEDDLAGDAFSILESAENFFEVTSFDSRTNEMRGRFACTMVSPGRQILQKFFPDTLRFTDGRFYAKLPPPFYPR